MDGNLSLSYSNDPTSSFPPGASFLLLPLTRSEDRRTPELRGPTSEAVDCSGGEYGSTAVAALGGSVTVVIESLGFFSFNCWSIILGSRVETCIFVRTFIMTFNRFQFLIRHTQTSLSKNNNHQIRHLSGLARHNNDFLRYFRPLSETRKRVPCALYQQG